MSSAPSRSDPKQQAASPYPVQATSLRRSDHETRGLSGLIRRGFRQWTRSIGGPELEERLAHIPSKSNEYGVDPFGLDLEFTKAAIAPVLWLYRNYFRVEAFGIENIPQGRALLISNHSGQLPFDGAMIGAAMLVEPQTPRMVRSMVEKWVPSLPYASTVFARLGQVVGTPENCRRLLQQGEAILVFPEGVRGISKLYRDRYRLQEFGNGFMRLALETNTPIVPVGVVGAEEQAPALADLKGVARLFGMPSLPITPTGLPLPLPVKYRIYFGEPMTFSGSADDEDAEIARNVDRVKEMIQSLLNQGLRDRKGIFW